MITLEKLNEVLVEYPQIMGTLLLNLELNGFIKLENRQNPTLETAHLVNGEKVKKPSVDDWIDEWRSLFTKYLLPHNLSMGIGNRQVCLLRMELFVNKVSNDRDRIFEATKAYLNDCIKHGRLGKLPQYFILPQDGSPLASRDIKTGELYDYYNNIINNKDHYKDISTHVI